MTVPVVDVPHIGLPDWKLDRSAIEKNRRYPSNRERREARHDSSQYFRSQHDHHHHSRDKDKERRRQERDKSKSRNNRSSSSARQEPSSGRRHRQPQHEIEFFSDEFPPKTSSNNNNNKEEPALFTFPWNWNLTTAVNNNDDHAEKRDYKEKHHHNNNDQHHPHHNQKFKDKQQTWSESEGRDKGVPSVVFAIKDDEEPSRSSPTNTFEDFSEDKHILKEQRKIKQEQARQKPKILGLPTLDHRHHSSNRRPPDPPDLPDELMPIPPTPHVPVMVGDKETPIACSESLVGSVHRHYTRDRSGYSQDNYRSKKRPPNYRRTVKKRTIEDLTALESVSTYDLEQRYKAKEVKTILASASKAKGKDSIALPKLLPTSAPSPIGTDFANPIATQQQHRGKSGPPGRIGNHIVYNLSGPTFQNEDTIGKSISAHTKTLSDSLEKMKCNLRQKQSLLTQTVSDLKAKQQQQQLMEEADRLRHSTNTRKPESLPLLQNQGYISDIFSDIASKMSKSVDRRKQMLQRGKEPYIPKAREILNAQKKESERAKHHHGTGGSIEPINLVDPSEQEASTAASQNDVMKYRFPSRAVASGSNKQDETLYRLHSLNRTEEAPQNLDKEVPHPPSQKRQGEEECHHTLRSTHKLMQETVLSGEVARPHNAYGDVIRPPSRGTQSSYVDSFRPPSRGRQSLYDETARRHPSRTKHSRYEDELEIGANNLCDLAAPLAEHFGAFVSPKSSSSLYLPNIKSRRGTPVPDAKLPFRPSTTAPSTQLRSVRDVIDVTSQAASLGLKNVIDVTSQVSQDTLARHPDWVSRVSADSQSKDVIDVASLASSLLSKTTVKDVICVEEDSQGNIRAKRKLSAMPKHIRNRRSRGPPLTSTPVERSYVDWTSGWDWTFKTSSRYNKGQADLEQDGDNGICELGDNDHTDDVYAGIRRFDDNDQTDEHEAIDLTEEQGEETEIVFAPSKDANKSLFDGIWDIEIPKFFSADKESIDPSKTTGDRPIMDIRSDTPLHRATSPPISTLELKGPVNLSHDKKGPANMSRYSQEKSADAPTKFCFKSHDAENAPTPKETMASWLPPIAIKTQGGTTGFVPHILGGCPLPSSKNLTRGREPSVLPWAYRALGAVRRDAPIVAHNPREPEGTVTGATVKPQEAKIARRDPEECEEKNEDEDDTTEDDDTTSEPPSQPAKPVKPYTSAFAKKNFSSERSTETRSVTFQDVDTLLGPKKDEKIPNYICTDQKSTTTDALSRLTKSVRRNEHPWEKDSQCSSRKAFHDLSTRTPDRDGKNCCDVLQRSRPRRHKSRINDRNGVKLRSMYDEILDGTSPQHVIILDDQASQQYEVFPANIDLSSHFSGYNRRWNDFTGSLTGSLDSYGQTHGEGGSKNSIKASRQRKLGDTFSASSKESKRSERALRKRDGTFFDFLCF